MPYTIVREDSLLQIRWYGVLVNDDLTRIFAELPKISSELGFAPDVIHLFDEVDRVEIEPGALVAHTRARVTTDLTNRVRSASVGTTATTFGYALLFRNLNANPHIVMEVFTSREDAFRWLREPKETAPWT